MTRRPGRAVGAGAFFWGGVTVESSSTPRADDEWNAGHLGCGPLVLDLRKKLKAMPGSVLRVIALDISAPHDIPAWCRLTRNELLAHDPASQSFWIRSRADWS